MFSSEQILQVSGDLNHKDDLKDALEYALKKSGFYDVFTRKDNPSTCCFQITEDGKYCIGWHKNEGWEPYQFDFDIEIISRIIINHLLKQEIEYGGYDGSYSRGYLMKNIDDSFLDEKDNIKNPFYGIVSFEPFTCFYAK